MVFSKRGYLPFLTDHGIKQSFMHNFVIGHRMWTRQPRCISDTSRKAHAEAQHHRPGQFHDSLPEEGPVAVSNVLIRLNFGNAQFIYHRPPQRVPFRPYSAPAVPKIGALKAETYAVVEAAPGLHQVALFGGENLGVVNFVAETGHLYFVRVQPGRGIWASQALVQLLSQEQGKEFVSLGQRAHTLESLSTSQR